MRLNRNKLAGNLSFPERARVELARALCTEPSVLLLDEAMAALNHVEMDEISCSCCACLRAKGLTLRRRRASHARDHVRSANASSCLISASLSRSGTPAEVSRNPHVIEAYLGRSGWRGQADEQSRPLLTIERLMPVTMRGRGPARCVAGGASGRVRLRHRRQHRRQEHDPARISGLLPRAEASVSMAPTCGARRPTISRASVSPMFRKDVTFSRT